MNIKQLHKQVGTDLRLRPLPIRRESNGGQLPSSDDLWRLETILDNPARLKLKNLSTHHVVELQSDNVRGYQSPDFLLLRCELTISPTGISFEPVHKHNPVFARLETQMPGLLDEMRSDLAKHPLSREFVLLERTWAYWAGGDDLAYHSEEHEDLSNKCHILANHGLIVDITRANVRRFRMSEEFAEYLGA
jgi:hypothetical protein